MRNLTAAAAALLELAAAAPAGRAALTLIPGVGGWDCWSAAGIGLGTGDHIQIRPRGTD